MRELAHELLGYGFSVIPIQANGTKAPALPSFDAYKSERRPTAAEIDSWFSVDGPIGIGIICGVMSGNLVVLDFEEKDVYRAWAELCKQEGLPYDHLPLVSTPRGFHAYARLETPERGRKLASKLVERDSKGGKQVRPEVLIEFRGDGQYVVGPGSPAECHPLRQAGWELQSGPDLSDVPVLPPEIWEALCRAAQAFSEHVETSRIKDGLGKITADDQRPGTDYCRRATIEDFGGLLAEHGWSLVRRTVDGRQIWRRPGKTDAGGSATLGAVTTSLGHTLYVFSSNAAPFESDTCYSIFAARALLRYDGDYGATAGQCRVEGFGKPAAAEIREEVEGYIAHWQDEARLKELEGFVDNWRAVSRLFRSTWDAKRQKEIGDDPHRYTRALLYFAASSLSTPEISGLRFGVGLVKLWRRKYQREPQRADDADYMSRQAADILGLLDRNEMEAQAEIEAAGAGDTEEQNTKWIRDKLGIAFGAFLQYRANAEEATYWLRTEDGALIKIGDIRSWESCVNFERALRGWASPIGGRVQGFSGTLPEALRPVVAWNAVMRVLFAVCRVEGVEDTTSHAVTEWVHDYAESYGVFDESGTDDDRAERGDHWGGSALNGIPFVDDGKIWVPLDGFLRWVNTTKNERFTRQQLIDQLRAAGFEKSWKQPTTRDGRRVRRRFWTVDVVGDSAVPF